MKKILSIFLFSLVILFTACQKADNGLSVVNPDAAPNPDNTPNPEIPENSGNSALLKNTEIPEAALSITYPETYNLAKNSELNRRGSFASYDFQSVLQMSPPTLEEVQFFNQKSVQDFNQKCPEPSLMCFEGLYPSVEEFRALKKSFEQISDYKNYHVYVFNEQNFLVTNFPCSGDSCIIREYVTFVGDTGIYFWINMQDDNDQSSADELFKKVRVEK